MKHSTVKYKNLLFLLFFLNWTSVSANFVKMKLNGISNCLGQLEVSIAIKASAFSTDLSFQLGSSTIALNFNPEVVQYQSYTPFEFNANTSAQAAMANWTDQQINSSNHFGLIGLVLHKDFGGAGNYDIDQNTWIKIGTIQFSYVSGEFDPEIKINNYLSIFNTPANDGVVQIPMEDYPIVEDWSCPSCTDIVGSSSMHEPLCLNSELGIIKVQFNNAPTETHINISVDGGSSFPHQFPDNQGSGFINGLAEGEYDVWARWGSGICPVQFAPVTIYNSAIPNVTATANNCGELTISFPDEPSRTHMRLSIDGGNSYPYYLPDNTRHYTISGLAASTYDIWAQWGTYHCPVDVNDVTVQTTITPPDATVNVTYGACGIGILNFSFVNDPARSHIQFSIDDGNTFEKMTDNLGNYSTFVEGGSYYVWVKWGNNDCPSFMGRINVNDHNAPIAYAEPLNQPCTSSSSLGAIKFYFNDHPNETYIYFSVDGGSTYPYNYYTYAETGNSFHHLPAGNYDIWARFGPTGCPMDIDDVTLTELDDPTVSVVTSNNECKGAISFVFDDHPTRTGIEFSLNGGASFYPSVPDNSGSYTFDNLTPGDYFCRARWGNDECLVDLGTVKVQYATPPPVIVNVNTGICGSNSIEFRFTDTPGRTTISLSIDGGTTFVNVPDNSESYIFHPHKTSYHVVYKWGNGDCLTDYGPVLFNSTPNAPVGSASLALPACQNTGTSGQIRFDFINHPGRTGIEFSIDGGNSYPYGFADASLTGLTPANIPAGTYDVWVRWGNNACPVDIQDVVVTTEDPPVAMVANCTGSLILTYPDNLSKSELQFSIDGGNSYPHVTPDDNGLFIIDNLSQGVYSVWVRWGVGNCSTELGDVVINQAADQLCTGFDNFDDDYFGIFNQSTNDDLDWMADANGTPSNNTGPPSIFNQDQYIYVEASSNFNKTAELTTDCFSLTQFINPQLSFDYHMYGAQMGTLEIELYDALYGLPLATLFSESGDQGNQWHNHTSDLSSWSDKVVYLVITGKTGSSYTSDMALDNFCIQAAPVIVCNPVDFIGFEYESSTFWNLVTTPTSKEFHSTQHATTGTGSWMLKGNAGSASSLTSFPMNYAHLTSIELHFDYRVASITTQDQLIVEISLDNWQSVIPIDTLMYGDDFYNNPSAFYNKTVVIDGVTFTNSTRIRFRSATTTIYDYFFLDNIQVITCTPNNTGGLKRGIAKSDAQPPSVGSGITVYPNPASKSDILTIETDIEDIVNGSIVDINGRLVRELTFDSELINIHLGELQSGVYSIVIETNSSIATQKFIVLE